MDASDSTTHPGLAALLAQLDGVGADYMTGDDGDPDWLSIPTGHGEAIDIEPVDDSEPLPAGFTRPMFALWFRVWDASHGLVSETPLSLVSPDFAATAVRAAVAQAGADTGADTDADAEQEARFEELRGQAEAAGYLIAEWPDTEPHSRPVEVDHDATTIHLFAGGPDALDLTGAVLDQLAAVVAEIKGR